MIEPFSFDAAPGRVVFGAGTLRRLPDEIERLGLRRVLVLSTPNHAAQGERVATLLGQHSVGIFAKAAMHTPVKVTEEALTIVAGRQVDGILAVGGGSTIGLGKAIAFRTDLPQVVVPTTYAGSEMTDLLGETSGGAKTTKRSPRVRPEVVVYDVDLTLSLPGAMSATSGMNALAHAVEALYARDGNPLTSLMAEEGTRALVGVLPTVVANPQDVEARTQALYGAWLCGCCLGAVSMALHHKLCHVLGGSFNLPHSETHAVLLPHTLAYNAPMAEPAVEKLSRVLGGSDPVLALYDLGLRCGTPTNLRELGLREIDLDRAADLAVLNPYWNPRPIEKASLKDLLVRALRGARPQVTAPGLQSAQPKQQANQHSAA